MALNQLHRVRSNQHMVGFSKIAQDAKRLGIEIINASPDSKIKAFKKVPVKDLLCTTK